MKKFLATLSCFILLPTAALGLTTLSDTELSKVSAQAGITMTMDDITIFQAMDRVYFVDDDGGDLSSNNFSDRLIGESGGAGIYLEGVDMDVIRVNAIAKHTQVGDMHPRFDITRNRFYEDFKTEPMTIDVMDEMPGLSPGFNYMLPILYDSLPLPDRFDILAGEYLFGLLHFGSYNKAGIHIGLPTIDIFIDEFTIDAITARTTGRYAKNDGASYGEVGIKGLDLAMLVGALEFTAAYQSSLQIAGGPFLMYLEIDEMRYTDTDGLGRPGLNDAGASLVMENIRADNILINVLTHTPLDAKLIGDLLTFDLGALVELLDLRVLSTSQFPTHLDEMDNYILMSLQDLLQSYHGAPLWFFGTQATPYDTAMHMANIDLLSFDDPYSQLALTGGLLMLLPTAEIWIDQFNIDAIRIDDPTNMAVNDNASFFPVEIKGSEFAIINGMLSISTH